MLERSVDEILLMTPAPENRSNEDDYIAPQVKKFWLYVGEDFYLFQYRALG